MVFNGFRESIKREQGDFLASIKKGVLQQIETKGGSVCKIQKNTGCLIGATEEKQRRCTMHGTQHCKPFISKGLQNV